MFRDKSLSGDMQHTQVKAGYWHHRSLGAEHVFAKVIVFALDRLYVLVHRALNYVACFYNHPFLESAVTPPMFCHTTTKVHITQQHGYA